MSNNNNIIIIRRHELMSFITNREGIYVYAKKGLFIDKFFVDASSFCLYKEGESSAKRKNVYSHSFCACLLRK